MTKRPFPIAFASLFALAAAFALVLTELILPNRITGSPVEQTTPVYTFQNVIAPTRLCDWIYPAAILGILGIQLVVASIILAKSRTRVISDYSTSRLTTFFGASA